MPKIERSNLSTGLCYFVSILLMDLVAYIPGTSFPSNLGRVVVETETEKRQTAEYRDQNP